MSARPDMAVGTQSALAARSAQIGRKRRPRAIGTVRRSAPPVACTTASAVREHALWLTADVVAIADYERALILAIAARTTDAETIGMLRQLLALGADRRGHAEHTAGFLDGCVAKLEAAEELRDWDGLADLRCFTGKELAGLINPLLDTIGDPMRLGEIPDAQARLAPYFETFGAAIFEGRITYSMNRKRRATLSAEFARWELCGDSCVLRAAS